MPQTRSARLQPLQQIADQVEDEARRQMAECQRQVAEHETRLAELQRYLADYLAADSRDSTPALVVNRHAFIARLREAERFQRTLLEQAQERRDAERTRWLLKRRDVGVLEQLAASYRMQEQRHVERQVQKDSDERAGQAYLRALSLDAALQH